MRFSRFGLVVETYLEKNSVLHLGQVLTETAGALFVTSFSFLPLRELDQAAKVADALATIPRIKSTIFLSIYTNYIV